MTSIADAQPRRGTDVQYDRAYLLGFKDGEEDARRDQPFEFDHENRVRRSTQGFRRGYVDGYRDGYHRHRPPVTVRSDGRPFAGQRRGGYQDPAFSRGQSEGFRRGFEDGRGRDRYDPVRYREYREGDAGYFSGYGSRDGYRNNYRDGFRKGYEEGYRDGSRATRR